MRALVVLVLSVGVAAAAPAKPHAGVTGDLDCNACHTAASWKLSATAGSSGFDHDRTGFALRGAHVQTSCAGCHNGAKPAATCDSCHRDPHFGRMNGQCYECHTAVAWSDVGELEQHRRTRMPLTGKHAVVDCVACHKNQAARQYTDTPVDCFACHQSDYRAATTHPNHDGTDPKGDGKPYPRDCAMCHNPIGWSPAFSSPSFTAQIARTEHESSFSLTTGSHRTVECNGCHIDGRRPHAVRCDGCHDENSLRGEHRSRVTTDATSCLHCHPRGARR
jgi:hypothetical protein